MAKGKGSGNAYLIRHGDAEDRHALGDDARALTAEGRREFRALAAELADDLGLVGVATSLLVRAVQTAEILAEACGVEEVVVRGELALGRASATSIAALLHELGPGWALVGHNPTLALALAKLLDLDGEPRFRKGAVAALKIHETHGAGCALAWTISPGRKRQSTLDD